MFKNIKDRIIEEKCFQYKRKIIFEVKNEIIKLYLEGKSTSELSNMTGYSAPSILKILKFWGIPTRTQSQEAILRVLTRKGNARKIFQDDNRIDLALSMYYSGSSYFEVADYFGCKWTVINDLNRNYMDKISRKEAFKDRQSDTGRKGVAGFKKKMEENPEFAKRLSERMSGDNNICKKPGVREKILEEWSTNKDRRVVAIMKNHYRKRTSFDIKVENVIKENNLPYTYCGDGKLVIDGKCPDFMHNSEPIVVEVFNNIHHELAYGSINAYITARSNHFTANGYKCLFINELSVKDNNKIKDILTLLHSESRSLEVANEL